MFYHLNRSISFSFDPIGYYYFRCKGTNFSTKFQMNNHFFVQSTIFASKRNKMEQSRFAGLCYFCAYNLKKLLEILNFFKIMTIFALSIKKDWRHRGERLSF